MVPYCSHHRQQDWQMRVVSTNIIERLEIFSGNARMSGHWASPAPCRHVRSWHCLERRLRSRRKSKLRWWRPQIGRKHCRIDGGEKRIPLGRFAAKGHEVFLSPWRQDRPVATWDHFSHPVAPGQKDLYRYKCSLPLVPCDRGTRIRARYSVDSVLGARASNLTSEKEFGFAVRTDRRACILRRPID